METRGFHCVNGTESYHPYYENWWPHGHIIGWENLFVHEFYNLVEAVINNKPLEPYTATFEVGYIACVICNTITESTETGKKVSCEYE